MLTLNELFRIPALLSLLALVLVADYTAAQTCVQPPPGIIAWWPLDETSGTTAGDRVGTHIGAYANAPLPDQGKVRGALRFNGTNYVAAADSDAWAFGAGDFTVELWANFDTPGSGDIVHAGDIFIGNDEGPGSVNKWFFALGGGVLHFTVYNTLNPPPNVYLVRASFSPIVGQWYHLAITKSGTLFTIYVNGLEVGSEISASPIANANAPLTIGQAENLGFMNGRLDEVTVYSRALSPQELVAIVDADSAGKCISLQIRPASGGDTGSVSVRIHGTGFAQGATVKLVRAGEPDIAGDGIATVGASGSTIDTTFDLRHKPRGAWDVLVTTLHGVPVSLPDGFTIEEGSAPRLWVDVVGLPVIRTGVSQDYWVAYGTTGNVDVPVSTLLIALPRNFGYTLDVPVFQGPNPPVARDSGQRGDTTLLHIALANLTPSSSGAIRMSLKTPEASNVPLAIRALIYPARPLGTVASAPTANRLPGRITHIAFRFPPRVQTPGQRDDGHIGFVTPDGTVFQWEGGPDLEDVDHDLITESPYIPEEWDRHANGGAFVSIPELTDDQATRLYDWARAHTGTGFTYTRDYPELKDIDHNTGACDGYIEAGFEFVEYRNGQGLVDDILEEFGAPPGLSNLSPQLMYEQLRSLTGDRNLPPWPVATWLETLLDFIFQPGIAEGSESEKLVSTIGSWDPNDKVGPDGSGTDHFVMGTKPIQYSVFFENLETATAPAQEVVITDQLDTVNMDLSTFSLGPMAFGGRVVTPPLGQSAFATTVDLRPGNNLVVNVTASLNPNSGLVTWRFTSIDPATGNPPTDPRVGFLPPNLVPPEGDGSVLFTIRPRGDLATGTELTNRASIVFDTNAPIVTPSWLNTLDNTEPISQVSPLLATQTSASFEVQWSGTDAGAGIRDFTIYVSDNGGPFDVALAQTTQTSATFTGVAGHTYAFYSSARDFTNNVEKKLPGPEASTTLVFTRYLAEGATSPFFDTQMALLNPGTAATTATLRFLTGAGVPIAHTVPVPARTRATVNAKSVPGLEMAEFSTVVESSEPLVVDRTMTWDGMGFGSHSETAAEAPSPIWYLAEGATHSGFDLFYLLQNPSNAPTTARVTYLRSQGPALEKEYMLPARSRTNIWVNVEQFAGVGAALAAAECSAVIESLEGTPIIVERAMYRSNQGRTFNAGHESMGVTTPSTQWFLAEGATGDYFDLFVLIANPTTTDASVRLTYLLDSGQTLTRTMVAPANARSGVWVDLEQFDGIAGFPLANVAVSTTVESTNGVPLIVERAMWWPGTGDTWHEAHNSAGATATGTRWAVAEGEVGGPRSHETYLLIANTSTFAGSATVTLLFEDGTSVAGVYALDPQSRTNVPIGTDFNDVAQGKRFGAIVESTGTTPAQIVVERAMYSNAGNVRWAAGTNALATRLQ